MGIINNIIQTFKDYPLASIVVTILIIGSVWIVIEVIKAPLIEDER